MRKVLSELGEKLAGIYRSNLKRATANPTAEMILKAFAWINLAAVQERILGLLDFPVTICWRLTGQFVELGYEMSES